MPWEATQIDWDAFQGRVRKAMGTSVLLIGNFFRGQSDCAWPLRPTLLRLPYPADAGADQLLSLEGALRESFRSRAHLYLKPALVPSGTNAFVWWQVMQHYGAPTRLIDWTQSPYVAAYFAVVDHWDRDGVVWGFNPAARLRQRYEQPRC